MKEYLKRVTITKRVTAEIELHFLYITLYYDAIKYRQKFE